MIAVTTILFRASYFYDEEKIYSRILSDSFKFHNPVIACILRARGVSISLHKYLRDQIYLNHIPQ
jgi:hypothetical protein